MRTHVEGKEPDLRSGTEADKQGSELGGNGLSGIHAYQPAGPPPVACCLDPDLMPTCIVHPEGAT